MRSILLGVLIGCAVGCSGRVSEPSGLADPVGPVTFVLVNNTGSEIYVRWQQDAPVSDVNLGGNHLDLQTWCSMPCEQGCACLDCAPMPSAVKRITSGAKLTFTWSGTWYEPQSCPGGCGCDQARSTLAGSYQITVAGARGYAASGSTQPTEANGVLTPAALDLAKGACQAQVTAKLSAGAQTVELPISCTP
jgi:hypothetical protein